jgi:carboxymethylenebutenolidase
MLWVREVGGILSGWVQFQSAAGPAEGLLAGPSDAHLAIVVAPAHWGVTAHFQRVADRLVAAGNLVMVVSMYPDRAASNDSQVATAFMDALDDNVAIERLAGAVAMLKDAMPARPIVGIGFSLGAWAILELSGRIDDIVAVIACYGLADAGPSKAHHASAYQLHLADFDDYPADVEERFFDRVHDAGAQLEVHRYAGARHGFLNEEHPEDFNAAASEQAWDRISVFLEQCQSLTPATTMP